MTNTIRKVKSLFRIHFICWRILGFLPTEKYRQLYIAYALVVNIMVTIVYPIHLVIGLIMSNTLYDFIKNLAIAVTAILCSIKTIIMWLKFQNIKDILDIITKQNKRILLDKKETRYFKYEFLGNLDRVFKMFIIMYINAGVFAELSVLGNGILGTWRLLYPAYFVFDPFSNSALYFVAHVYQFIGASYLIIQLIVIDTFGTMLMALLSGQLHTLNMRLTKLGRDPNKTKRENNLDLLDCIQDHKDLLEYRQKLEEVLSFYIFVQIIFTSIIMCSSVAFLILFTADAFTLIYYTVYILATALEFMPLCYYGTVVEMEFENLTYAIFSSNWLEQDKVFKQNLRIFAETTKKPLHITAWLFYVNLDSFLFTCKNAYSMFALIMNMK
ncbi:odorant receptor 59a-like [Lucilia sericata]|uniref:odorant receptor 59a-like n=1 Tax=Lucilia sericata TaxID=13632 RepID=UPI0018A87E01|nr:odorant receptor 59a-like [Lucilia sericata]